MRNPVAARLFSACRSATRPSPVRLAGIALAAVTALGAPTACGALGTTTAMGEPSSKGSVTPSSDDGDVSPRKVLEGGATDSGRPLPGRTTGADGGKSTGTRTPTATATPTLRALKQPTSAFPTPKLPKPPAESADELDQVVYTLKARAWTAAGLVDSRTKADCTISTDTMAKLGTHTFDCDVRFDGVTVKFHVEAKVTATKVDLHYSTPNLPVAPAKATYEATRQAYRPARVTCDLDQLEVVRVGKSDGVVCWVTDVDGVRMPYNAKVLPDGGLAFTPDKAYAEK